MKTKTVLLTLYLALCLAEQEIEIPVHFNFAINEQMVKSIKENAQTWIPYEPNENPLRKYTDEELKYVMGMPGINWEQYKKSLEVPKEFPKYEFEKEEKKVSWDSETKADILPDNFDWRTTSVGTRCTPPVLNQGTCGSCYAFATSEMFSARYCSVVPDATAMNFSPQDILACNIRTNACDGGTVDLATRYLEDYGISTLSCQPYMESKTSSDSRVPSQRCLATKCASGEPVIKKYCKRGTTIIIKEEQRIKYEIMARGPLSTFMTSYSDLVNYKSGIYKHTTGSSQGGHAVTLFGWGVSGTTKYWIVMNSWGADWGQNGYFNADMSDTDSGVGDAGYYCIPDV